MKNLILISMFAWMGAAHAAQTTLKCEYNPFKDPAIAQNADATVVVVDSVRATCDQGLEFEVSGVGLGFRLSANSWFVIACENTEVTDVMGSYYGVKGDAELGLGGGGGFYLNKNGICQVESISGAIGAAVSISKLTIRPNRLLQEAK
jgi:hypothetical protein